MPCVRVRRSLIFARRGVPPPTVFTRLFAFRSRSCVILSPIRRTFLSGFLIVCVLVIRICRFVVTASTLRCIVRCVTVCCSLTVVLTSVCPRWRSVMLLVRSVFWVVVGILRCASGCVTVLLQTRTFLTLVWSLTVKSVVVLW